MDVKNKKPRVGWLTEEEVKPYMTAFIKLREHVKFHPHPLRKALILYWEIMRAAANEEIRRLKRMKTERC